MGGQPTSQRDYKKEYRRDHSSAKAKKDRAGRNKANRMKKPGKGKNVHHKNGNPQDNRKSNLEIRTAKNQRKEGGRKSSAGKGKKRPTYRKHK